MITPEEARKVVEDIELAFCNNNAEKTKQLEKIIMREFLFRFTNDAEAMHYLKMARDHKWKFGTRLTESLSYESERILFDCTLQGVTDANVWEMQLSAKIEVLFNELRKVFPRCVGHVIRWWPKLSDDITVDIRLLEFEYYPTDESVQKRLEETHRGLDLKLKVEVEKAG